ncbi:hypothetical protein ACFPOU_13110 [Massilia jejuensis]|uniref:Uncharacterized protein n=1 Tax=Massilia jejuensis TaxID=648894 RepID=A0ABW0PJ65_9BURK
MADDETPSANSSTTARIVAKLKDHPITLAILAIGAVLAFVANFWEDIHKLRPIEDPPPLVRVQRFQVSGDAVSLMLIGKIDGRLKELLGGRPIVWQNGVYRAAKELHSRFAKPLGSNTFDESFSGEEHKATSPETPLISGAVGGLVALDAESTFSLLGIPSEDKRWKISFIEEMTPNEISAAMAKGTMPAGSVAFSQLLNCGQAAKLLADSDMNEADLYAELAQHKCERIRFPVVATYLDAACGGTGWSVALFLPKLTMNVLVIQNISGKPAKINRIIGLDGSTNRVGDGTLLPEDRLIIPTGLHLEMTNESRELSTPTIPLNKLPKTIAELSKPIVFMASEEPQLVPENVELSLSTDSENASANSAPPELVPHKNAHESDIAEADDAAQAMPSESETTTSVTKDGPVNENESISQEEVTEAAPSSSASPVPGQKAVFSLTPQQITGSYELPSAPSSESEKLTAEYVVSRLEVNGITIPVDPISAGGMYISNSFPGGSCPHLYMVADDKLPVYLGKILVGRSSKAHLGSDRRHLRTWPDKITVSEKDPEITYLYGIKVSCELGDGRVVDSPGIPTAGVLRYPLIMHRGEEREFRFDKQIVEEQCSAMYVEVKGYYVPTDVTVKNTAGSTEKSVPGT